MQITATWGVEEVAVEVEAECRTLAALKALLQDALPEVDVGTVRLEVGGRELARRPPPPPSDPTQLPFTPPPPRTHAVCLPSNTAI